MKSGLNYCPVGGLLVGTEGWLPDSIYEYNWGTFDPRIGCNSLVCGACGQVVRHLAGVVILDNALVKPTELYDTQDWLTLSYVKSEPSLKGRLYACRCNWRLQFGNTELDPPVDESEREFQSQWRCAGHPHFTLPGDFEGVHFDANTNIETTVQSFLVPAPSKIPSQTAHVPGYQVMRLYVLLRDTGLGSRVGKAIGNALTDSDPLVRRGALEFFYEFPQAPGGELLVKALQQDRALFNGQIDPTNSRYDLEEHLLRVLERRLTTLKDIATVRLVRQEIMQGTKRPGLIQALVPLDFGWVRDNAGDIVKANPASLKKFVYALRNYADDEIVAALKLARDRQLVTDTDLLDTLRQVFRSDPDRGNNISVRLCATALW